MAVPPASPRDTLRRGLSRAARLPRAVELSDWLRPGASVRLPGTVRLQGAAVGRSVARPRWWGELLIIAWLAWIYDILTGYAPLRAHAAISNAWGIWHAETALHLDPELTLNRWLAAHHVLGQIASYYYDNAHFVVTFGLLGLLLWRSPSLYRPLRSSLALVNVIAFAVFWLYPLAPPRMLTSVGFYDVVGHSNTFGQWHTGKLATNADQFAAMPSLHIAWAVWCAIVVWRLTSRRLWRTLAVIYPFLTALVIFSTGNHFLFDAFGGLAAIALALLFVKGAEAALAAGRLRLAARPSEPWGPAPEGMPVLPSSAAAPALSSSIAVERELQPQPLSIFREGPDRVPGEVLAGATDGVSHEPHGVPR